MDLLLKYINYFSGDKLQLLTIFFGLTCWLFLAGVGQFFFRTTQNIEILPIIGWSIVSIIYTIFGVFTQIHFSIIFFCLVIFSLSTIIYSYFKHYKLVPENYWRIITLLTPLLLLTAAMNASQWDEFSHWLPAKDFLINTGGFPTTKNPTTGTPLYNAYPFAWPILTMLPSLAVSQSLEMSAGIFNLLMLSLIGILSVKIFFKFSNLNQNKKNVWGIGAISILMGTALNPTFIQKIVLTNYADVATAVCTAISVYLGWELLNALSRKDSGGIHLFGAQFGLVMALLVNIKQSNLALFGVITIALVIVTSRDKSLNLGDLLKKLPMLLGPGLLICLIWRYHVSISLGEGAVEATFMPIENWNFGIIHLIIKQMLYVAFKKIGFFGLMGFASIIAFRYLKKINNEYERLITILALVFLGHNAFLLLTYIGSFSKATALTVVSYWRYNTHVGLLAVIFIAVYAAQFSHKGLIQKVKDWPIQKISIILVLALPIIFSPKLRFDLQPPKPHINKVAKELANYLQPSDTLHILDPLGTGESVVITRYRINRNIGFLWSKHWNSSYEDIKKFASTVQNSGYLLIHSANKNLLVFFPNTKKNASHLMQKRNKKWYKIKSWEFPDKHSPT